MEDQQASGWNEMGDLVAKNDVSQVPFYLQPANKTKIKEVSAAKGVPVETMLGNIQKSLSLGQTTPQKAQQELDAHHATVTKKPSVGMAKKLPQKAPSPMAMMGPPAPPAPMSSPQNPQEQPGTVITDTALVPEKGSYEGTKEGDSSKDVQTDVNKLRLDNSAANEQYQTWANLPVNKDNEGMIGNLQRRVDMLSKAPQEDWLKPLLAYSDSKFGGNLMAGYIPPPAQKLLLKYEDELAKRTAQKGEDFNKYLAAAGSGSSSDAYTVGQYNSSAEGVKHPLNNVMEIRQYTADRADFRNVMNKIDRDPLMRNTIASQWQIKTALHILNSGIADPKAFNEAQNMLRTAIQTGGMGRSGVHERQETYIRDLGMDLDAIKQYIDGDMATLNTKDPKMLHLKALGRLAEESVSAHLKGRMNEVSSGFASRFNAPGNEWMQQGLDEKFLAYGGGEGLGTSVSHKDGQTTYAKPNPSAPSKKINTKSYSPDVKAYAKEHGISEAAAQHKKDSYKGG